MYICIYMHIDIYIHSYIHLHTYIHICIYSHMSTRFIEWVLSHVWRDHVAPNSIIQITRRVPKWGMSHVWRVMSLSRLQLISALDTFMKDSQHERHTPWETHTTRDTQHEPRCNYISVMPLATYIYTDKCIYIYTYTYIYI